MLNPETHRPPPGLCAKSENGQRLRFEPRVSARMRQDLVPTVERTSCWQKRSFEAVCSPNLWYVLNLHVSDVLSWLCCALSEMALLGGLPPDHESQGADRTQLSSSSSVSQQPSDSADTLIS
jgi:hypothetical protein